MSSRPLLFCRPLQAEYCIIFPCFFQSYAALILQTSTPSCQELNIHLWKGQQCPNFSCQYQAGQPSLVGGNICPHLPTCSSAAPQEHVQLATGKLHLVQQFLRSSNLAPSWGYNLIVVLLRKHTGTNTWVSHAAWINSHSIWVKNQLPVESLQACCSSLYKPPDSGNACPRRDWDTWNIFFPLFLENSRGSWVLIPHWDSIHVPATAPASSPAGPKLLIQGFCKAPCTAVTGCGVNAKRWKKTQRQLGVHLPFKFHQIWGWGVWVLDKSWLSVFFHCLFFTFLHQIPDGRITLTHSFRGRRGAEKNTQGKKKPHEQLLNWINNVFLMVTPGSRAILPSKLFPHPFALQAKKKFAVSCIGSKGNTDTVFMRCVRSQGSTRNLFIFSSWWKASAWKFSNNDKKAKRHWDGSKCKVLSSSLDWFKPLPVIAEVPLDIFFPDFLQAGRVPILQAEGLCCQQKGNCHTGGAFGFPLILSPNQAEQSWQLVLQEPQLFIRQKWCEMRHLCLSYNITTTTGSFWLLRNSDVLLCDISVTEQMVKTISKSKVPTRTSTSQSNISWLPCSEQTAHKNPRQPTLRFSSGMNFICMQVNMKGNLL